PPGPPPGSAAEPGCASRSARAAPGRWPPSSAGGASPSSGATATLWAPPASSPAACEVLLVGLFDADCGEDDVDVRPVPRARDLGDRVGDVLALDDLAEDRVLAVEPRRGRNSHEELGAVGVRTSVGHREI